MADSQIEALMQFKSVRVVTKYWPCATDEQKLQLVQHLLARAELTGFRLDSLVGKETPSGHQGKTGVPH